MSKLYFEYGPMGAQKTTKLLATAYNYEEHGGKVLVTKPSLDTKGDRRLVSRIGISREADFLTTPELDVEQEVTERLKASREKDETINALLVDEAQFLEPKQVDQLLNLAVLHSIPVLAFGLRTDFKTQLFPGSARLLAVSHVIRESITMCAVGDGCESRAIFNARLINGDFVAEGRQVAIDGIDTTTYTSLCGPHYIEKVGPIHFDPTESTA